MMSHRILPVALLLCALFAACGELPTQNDVQAQPGGASYDEGGYTIGSGGAVQSGGYTIGSGGGTPAEEGFGLEGGGVGFGSGNLAAEDGDFVIGSDTGVADDGGGFGIGSGRTGAEDAGTAPGGDSERSGYTIGSGG